MEFETSLEVKSQDLAIKKNRKGKEKRKKINLKAES